MDAIFNNIQHIIQNQHGLAFIAVFIGGLISAASNVEMRGSRVTISGKPAIIAAEVKKGDNTLVLRDSAGVPAWAGWRR
jgi:hypothetical protein